MRELDKGKMFPKDNIVRDRKTMRDRIITPIPLLSFAITKKTTKSRPRQVLYAHAAEEERNRQSRKSKGGDSLEVTQKGPYMELDFE